MIERAELPAIGLVDSGSYRTSVEVRQGAWLSASIAYGTTMDCRCQGPDCDQVVFEPGSLQVPDEVLAINGPATRVLGSRKRGTLIVDENDQGLHVELMGDDTTIVAREVKDQAKVAPIYVRPILDTTDSEYHEEGRVRRFTRAPVRALLVKATEADGGHIPAAVRGVDPEPEGRGRRRRLWL